MVKKDVFVKTFFISLGIFLIGIFIGFFIEKNLESGLTSKTAYIESAVQEIELELLYFQGLNASASCDFLNEVVRKTNNNLDILANQITVYSEKNIIFTVPDVLELKTKYTFLLIKDWILQERIKKACGSHTVTVLYFYSTEGCDDCLIQGNILTVLKNSFKEKLMIFPVDEKINLSMIPVLMKEYNVTKTPSIITNGVLHSGIVSKDQMKKIICNQVGNVTECLQ
jgi:hypothetical protein